MKCLNEYHSLITLNLIFQRRRFHSRWAQRNLTLYVDIDSERMILEIYDMTPLDENPILSKSNDIRYVLEVEQ